MGLSNYPPIFKEVFATHEFFRRLGFSASQVYLHLRKEDQVLMVVLKHSDKLFAVMVGETDLTEAQIAHTWVKFVNDIADEEIIPTSELEDAWIKSYIFNNMGDALATIRSKGIIPPMESN